MLAALLPQAWTTFSSAQQGDFTRGLVALLAKPYHRQALQLPPPPPLRSVDEQAYGTLAVAHAHYVNVVQSLVTAAGALRPLPVLPQEVLGHLASHYDAWHQLLPVMEHELMTATSGAAREQWLKLVTYVYEGLGEGDVANAAHRRFALSGDTRLCLALESSGFVRQAQRAYMECIRAEAAGGAQAQVPELELWENRWVECARQLGQWPVLGDFAAQLQYPDLLLESAYKTHDWETMQQCIRRPTMAASNAWQRSPMPTVQGAQEQGSPAHKLYEIYFAIVNRAAVESKESLEKWGIGIEALCKQCVTLSLNRWQLLPRLHTGSNVHKPLLHMFQQIVELRESAADTLAQGGHAKPVPHPVDVNFKLVSVAWRDRLPNKWEPLYLWDDIVCWRREVFKAISQTLDSPLDSAEPVAQNDTPWTVIKLAHTARKQGLPEVCLNELGTLRHTQIRNGQDKFELLREQILVCLSSAAHYRGGLHVINNVNMESFDSQQKAELFRMKGQFLHKLGARNEANAAFSHSLQVSGNFGKGWYSWAQCCDAVLAEQMKVHCAMQSMACYMQAVQHRCDSAKPMLARVLWLLSMDDEKFTLARALETYGANLPELVWVPWIPQLLSSLTRPEAPQVKSLLKKIISKFPQAIYYSMRAFVLERRELPADPTQAGDHRGGAVWPGQQVYSFRIVPKCFGSALMAEWRRVPKTTCSLLTDTQYLKSSAVRENDTCFASCSRDLQVNAEHAAPRAPTAGTHADELMATLRRTHPTLVAEMEGILEQAITQMRMEPLEDLLSTVQALFLKCLALPYYGVEVSMQQTLRGALAKILNKYFTVQQAASPRYKIFTLAYRAAFERDFVSDDHGRPRTLVPFRVLPIVVRRLKKWKLLLQYRLQSRSREVPLKNMLPHLAQLHNEMETWRGSSHATLEVPGQYAAGMYKELKPETHAKLLRFHSQICLLNRAASLQRRMCMLGSNGRSYHFITHLTAPHITKSDERVAQLHGVVKRLLEKHYASRRRDICVHVPIVVLITPRMRMTEDMTTATSLGEIYETDMQHRGEDPDAPMILARDRISAAAQAAAAAHNAGAAAAAAEQSEKIATYRHIVDHVVREDILARFVHHTLRDGEAVWAFKRTFAQQLGVGSLLAYTFACNDRIPHKFVFDRATGRVIPYDFRPGYTQHGMLDPVEEVPFRLTRNVTALLAPFLVDGVLTTAVATAAQGLIAQREALHSYLSLMLRDDMVSWHGSKSQTLRKEAEVRAIERQLSERMNKNVVKLLDRLESLCPREGLRDPNTGAAVAVDKRAHDLVEAAQNEGKLCFMPPTWMPWV
ncbi:hypothetical protein JKP88DRAFT_189050 [Tribonema minus]|uniref:Non-specific serine/threonine protein kinase n=1 Tax=Tribonema minus TaxID=303371 RepID=A0A835YW58_9STRA|nr:hypothetical protein JKP88DRAFT_189050 [Tribonema minus]